MLGLRTGKELGKHAIRQSSCVRKQCAAMAPDHILCFAVVWPENELNLNKIQQS